MRNFFRPTLVSLGFKALASGVRVPAVVETFNQWGRLVDLIRRLGINVFLDIGANRGFFSKHLRMSGYQGHLFSFEPNPEDHDRIRALAAGDPRWTACCYALGAESATRDFHINLCGPDQTVLSSFLTLKNQSDRTRTVTMEMRRLDEILPTLIAGIESPRIFLKMDTQGFDNQVLEGASGCLDQIVGMQSEISVIPLYHGMAHYTELLARYERLDFALVDMFVAYRQDGFVGEYDCVMARPSALAGCLQQPIRGNKAK